MHGDTPGMYAVQIKPSRRNSKRFELNRSNAVRGHYNKLRQQSQGTMPSLPARPEPVEVGAMVAGIYLNGRHFKQGDYCEYLPTVPRRGNVAEGSSSFYRLARIECFYVVRFGGVEVPLVQITDLPILGSVRSLRVISKPEPMPRPGWDTYKHILQAAVADVELIHIDSITHKVFLAPHFDSEDEMCAIRMWEAR